MSIDTSVQEVKVQKGMNILGIFGCSQCGACCYDYHRYLHQIGATDTEQCKNFEIQDGKAYCLSHFQKREAICERYFCGNTDFIFRFRYKGDETLRTIAEKLGTVPIPHNIPKLLPIVKDIEN